MGRQNILELEASGAAAPLATVPAWNARALRTPGAAQSPRALALVHTCMYNAWAAYDGNARQTVHGVAVRLPRAERDAASRAAAMGHAAHAILAGNDADPGADAGPFTPAGIGRTQAAALLDVRHRDQPFALMPAEVRPAAAARPLALVAVWCDVAQRVSIRDGHDDDRDVLLFFVLAKRWPTRTTPRATPPAPPLPPPRCCAASRAATGWPRPRSRTWPNRRGRVPVRTSDRRSARACSTRRAGTGKDGCNASYGRDAVLDDWRAPEPEPPALPAAEPLALPSMATLPFMDDAVSRIEPTAPRAVPAASPPVAAARSRAWPAAPRAVPAARCRHLPYDRAPGPPRRRHRQAHR